MRYFPIVVLALALCGCEALQPDPGPSPSPVAPIGLEADVSAKGEAEAVVKVRTLDLKTEIAHVRTQAGGNVHLSTDSPHVVADGGWEILPGTTMAASDVLVIPRTSADLAPPPTPGPQFMARWATEHGCPTPPPPPQTPEWAGTMPVGSDCVPPVETPRPAATPCLPPETPKATVPEAVAPCQPLTLKAEECRDVYLSPCVTDNAEFPRVGTPTKGVNFYYGKGPSWPCPGAPDPLTCHSASEPPMMKAAMAPIGLMGCLLEGAAYTIRCIFGIP